MAQSSRMVWVIVGIIMSSVGYHQPLPAFASVTPQSPAAMEAINIPFVENTGQVDSTVAYYARTFAGSVFVTQQGNIVYALSDAHAVSGSTAEPRKRAVLRERIIAEEVRSVQGMHPIATRIHHFRGSNPSRWALDSRTFRGLTLGEVYPGVEMTLEAHANTIEKRYYLAPGAGAQQIKMAIEGGRLDVNAQGGLEVETPLGPVTFSAPIAYQEIDGIRSYVAVRYRVEGQTYGFELGRYRQDHALVIDPILAATFVGGSEEDTGYAFTLDADGNAYIAGLATSLDFPGVTPASADDSFEGLVEAFVAKLNPDLTAVLAATYLGGSGPFSAELARAVAVDAEGNVFVAGRTNSPDFPGIGPDSADGVYGGTGEAFIVKLDPTLGSLLGATFYGGSSNEGASSIVIDASGDIFVGGETNASPDLPSVGIGSADPVIGLDEGFIAKFDNDLSTVINATYLGGSGSNERVEDLALDNDGNVYATGVTRGVDFPGVGPGSADDTFGGDFDLEGFVAKLDSNLSLILAASYIGGSEQDSASAIALDNDGNVFVGGRTSSLDFPGVGVDAADTTLVGSEDAFVAKMNSNLSSILGATFLGGSGSGDVVLAMTTDSAGNVYVTGETTSTDFPGVGPGSADDTATSAEAFVTRLNPTLTTIMDSTYLGGSGTEFGFGIALDDANHIYVGGFTGSADFPGVGPGSADSDFSVEEAFVAKLKFTPLNHPPDCSQAKPSRKKLWPPFHQFVPVDILNITDEDGDPISVTIESIFQDEPTTGWGTGPFWPDGKEVGTNKLELRSERSPFGNGRVYHIAFMAEDDAGGQCQGVVRVCVPLKKYGHHKAYRCVDNGPRFDSTKGSYHRTAN